VRDLQRAGKSDRAHRLRTVLQRRLKRPAACPGPTGPAALDGADGIPANQPERALRTAR
jgi:hypothetical protein